MMSRRSRSPLPQASKRKDGRNAPTDLLTFRWNGDMVYITPCSDFEDLITTSQTVFPQLRNVQRERITFSVISRVDDGQRAVRISSKAWPRLLSSLNRFEIVDVHLLPFAPRNAKSDTDVYPISHHDIDMPPKYDVEFKPQSSQCFASPTI